MNTTIRKVIQEDNFLSLAGNLTISFFGIAGFALLARTYAVDIFGQWVLYVTSGTFIEMFRFGITNTAVVRYLSGVNQEERLKYIGSNVLIGFVATFFIMVILWGCHILFPVPIKNAGYELFFTWYPIMALVNLPFNTALVVMQADQKFGKILMIRLLNYGGFFLFLLLNFLIFDLTLIQLVWGQLLFNFLSSLVCSLYRWDGILHIRKATKKTIQVLLNFGKYTTFTLIGTNLLRSADTLIISLSPMGTAAVALYSIPMKLTELQQIPLRSFAATAFPKMSKASIQGMTDEVRKIFYTYSGAMTYLFLFISLITFVFADFFVLIMGGTQYMGTNTLTGVSAANIVRVFSLYGLLLPIDRMTGIGLDSINKPDKNLIKVGFMVMANVIGDLVAVFVFKSLIAVAIASILFTILGIWIGFYFLDREMKINNSKIFSSGYEFYSDMYRKITKLISKKNN